MIRGRFDVNGRPRIRAMVSIPRFDIRQPVSSLLDTGPDYTCLNSMDRRNFNMSVGDLRDVERVLGVGGGVAYCREPAALYFQDGPRVVAYDLLLRIALSSTGGIPSLLGRNVFDNWRIEYDRSLGNLHCEVRSGRYT